MVKRGIRITAIFFVGVLASVVVAVIIAVGLFSVNQDYRDAVTRERFAKAVVTAAFQLTTLTGNYVLYQEDRARTQWIRRHKTLGEMLKEPGFYINETNQMILRLRRHHTTAHNLFVRTIESFLEHQDSEEASKSTTAREKMLVAGLLTVTQAMVSEASLLSNQSQTALDAAIEQISWMILSFILLLTVLMVGLWFVLARRVVVPIQELIAGIRAFGGNPDHHLRPRRADEIGEVATAFNEMAQRLQETMVSKDELTKEVVERKRAEDAIGRERDRAAEFLEIAEALIVALDPAGTVTLINRRGCEVLGYAEHEIVGRNWFETIIPEGNMKEVRAVHVKMVAGEVEPVEYFANEVCTKGGGRRFIAWHNTVIRDDDGAIAGSLSSGQDITERKQAEEKIKASLAEKEVLLREIHHRVKNNLQVVSSMLSLQAGTVTGDGSIDALEEAQRRVKVMARIHENLHKSDDLASINARDHLNAVLEDTMTSSGHDTQGITCRLDVDDIILDIDHAVACGQIVSELLSNSLKHAFPNGQSGNIEVSLHRRDGGQIELAVADNGKGLPENFDLRRAETLGIRLVHALTMQLSGVVDIDGSDGTCIQITFPENRS